MKLLFSLSVCLLCLKHQISAQFNINFEFDGKSRDCLIYVPASYDPSNPTPLVFNIHGFGDTGPGQRTYAKMDAVADTAGFLVAYPTGYNNVWNGGSAYYATTSPPAIEDDVQYFSDLIDTIGQYFNIDQTRVYACGMSNGGDMSYRLGCELSERIAAIGPVTGTMISDVYASCSPSKPMPVVHMHGTNDFISNIGGGPGWESLRAALLLFAGINNCPSPSAGTIPNIDPSDGTLTKTYQSECSSGAEILLYLVRQGGHTWPGSVSNFFTLFAYGRTSQDFDGSSELWQFFRRHERIDAPPIARQGRSKFRSPQLTVWPQPATNLVSIALPDDFNGTAQVEIRNITGHVLISRRMPFAGGKSLEAFSVATLGSSQIYLISVSGPNQIWNGKVLTQTR